ncbi:MAG: phosphoserine phosphatase SerB [Rhodothalassiaceae bacterium]
MHRLISLAVKPADGDALTAAVQRLAPAGPGRLISRRFWEAETGEDLADIGRRLAALPVDWCVQPLPLPPVKLFIADMDSSIIAVECIDELADFVGVKAQVAAITERAMQGELDFAGALAERLALLQGLEEAALAQVYAERVRFSDGAATLLAGLKAAGVHCILASGGFTVFTGRVAEALGFDAHHANRLELADGVLTGRAVPPILGPDGKRQVLEQALTAEAVDPADAVALGDGANDARMIDLAGRGFGMRAKPALIPHLTANLRHTGLDTLLHFLRLPARGQTV